MSKKTEAYKRACKQLQEDISKLTEEIDKKIKEENIFEKEYYKNSEMVKQYAEFVKVIDDICRKYIPEKFLVCENENVNIHNSWVKFNDEIYVDTDLKLTRIVVNDSNEITVGDLLGKSREQEVPRTKYNFSYKEFERISEDTVDAYHSFNKEYREVHKNLNILKTGAQGEDALFNRLKIIGEKLSIIQNARFTMEDGFTVEHDMIIVSPVGVFTVEIKNWSKDSYIDEKGYLINTSGMKTNVVEQALRHKHHLERILEKKLGQFFEVHPIIAWVNPDSIIKNDFDKIVVCNCNNIEFEILNQEKYKNTFTKEEREAICRILDSMRISNNVYPVKIDKRKIIEELSRVVVGIRALPELRELENSEEVKSFFKVIGGVLVSILGAWAISSFLDDK